MNYQESVKKGLFKKERIGFDRINKVLEKSPEKTNLISAKKCQKNFQRKSEAP